MNCEPEREPAVVAEVAEVAEVVRDALALERERPQPQRPRGRHDPGESLDCHRVGPGVRDRAVAGDAPGERPAADEIAALEQLVDRLVRVAEPLLEPQHLLADDREAEVPGLDRAGVHRPYRDLVHAFARDRHEAVLLDVVPVPALEAEVAPQRVDVRGPRRVAQPRALVGRGRADADEVVGRALHPVRAGEHVGEIGIIRPLGRKRHGEPERRIVHDEREMERESLAAIALVGAPQRGEPPALGGDADRDLAQPLDARARVPRRQRGAERSRVEVQRLEYARRIHRSPASPHPISRAASRYQSARYGGMYSPSVSTIA
jgi:hypothetical protein